MKKSIVFILGMVSGIVLTILLAVAITVYSSNKANSNVKMFEEPGDVIEAKYGFRVIQVVDEKAALVTENPYTGLGTTALILSEDEYFYNNQVIRLNKTQEFRQVGLYTYETVEERQMTVPIIQIFEKE